MEWNRAIVINQAALTRIVAGLIAMVELTIGGGGSFRYILVASAVA